jgi:hypothetical protein
MHKIVLLPLDERPCNMFYPKYLFNQKDIELVQPNKDILGNKKVPASYENLKSFLIESCRDAYGLVISMDMYLYGGIVPSRLHYRKETELLDKMQWLETLKNMYPSLKIFAFDLVMRCPQYSSNDEEPDYYATYGYQIFKTGWIKHRQELKISSIEENQELETFLIPNGVLKDYLDRRELNLRLNLKSLDLIKKGVLDFLVIPQDDAAQYGWTAKDQKVLLKYIDKLHIVHKVYLYPGADEVAITLLSRMISDLKQIKLKFYIQYPSPRAALTIPLLEDRYLDVTVRYQIRAAGGIVTSSINEADIILFVNASGDLMLNNAYIHLEKPAGLTHLRNLVDFVEIMKEEKQKGKHIAIADVATINGSDHQLMQLLSEENMLLDIDAYAGWNTSSNTLGTTIGFSIMSYLYTENPVFKDFLMMRYVEDYAYMAFARTEVSQMLKSKGMSYFDVSKDETLVIKWVTQKINEFIEEYLFSIKDHIQINKVWMPWHRMFEVGIKAEYIKKLL